MSLYMTYTSTWLMIFENWYLRKVHENVFVCAYVSWLQIRTIQPSRGSRREWLELI